MSVHHNIEQVRAAFPRGKTLDITMEDLYHAIEVLTNELYVDDRRVESCTVCIDDDDNF